MASGYAGYGKSALTKRSVKKKKNKKKTRKKRPPFLRKRK